METNLKLIFNFNLQVERPLIPVKPIKVTQPPITPNVMPPKPPIPKLHDRKASTASTVTSAASNPPSIITKEPPKVPNKPNFVIPRKTSGQVNVQGFVHKSMPSDIRKPRPIAIKRDPVPLPTVPAKEPMQMSDLKSKFEPKGVTSGASFQKPIAAPGDADSGVIPGETAFQRARRLAKENADNNSVSPILHYY